MIRSLLRHLEGISSFMFSKIPRPLTVRQQNFLTLTCMAKSIECWKNSLLKIVNLGKYHLFLFLILQVCLDYRLHISQEIQNYFLWVFINMTYGNSVSIFVSKLFNRLQWKTFKNNEKCFLLHLKGFFVLKILKYLHWFFGHVEKTTWLER